MRIWKWLVAWLVLGSLLGCGPKGPTPTLAPTLLPPTATLTPTSTPTPTPTETPLPTPTEIPLAARVNGQAIFLADLEREAARAGDAATRGQVLDAMIETVLLAQAEAAAGIVIADDELDAIVQAEIEGAGGREVFEAWLASNDLTEGEYRAGVRANLSSQRMQAQLAEELPDTAEHIHARHVLVATQGEAEAILAQLQNGADFATLAQTHSLDVSTRDRGGDLDFFPRGVLLAPELEEAAFGLSPGQMSGVIRSELLGYHVIQVLEREERPISDTNLEVIKANQREAVRRWREQLWANATIERFIEP